MALITRKEVGLLDLEIVPLFAGDLACLAADAQIDVDQL